LKEVDATWKVAKADRERRARTARTDNDDVEHV
jgi:hypothetical protein